MKHNTNNQREEVKPLYKIENYEFAEDNKMIEFFPLNILQYSTNEGRDGLFYLLMMCISEHGHNTTPDTLIAIANDNGEAHEEKEILAAKMLLTYFTKQD